MSGHSTSSAAKSGEQDAPLDDFVDELLGFSQARRFVRKGELPLWR